MKNKQVLKLLILFLTVQCIAVACKNTRNCTKDEFLYTHKVNPQLYTADSLNVLQYLNTVDAIGKKGFFKSKSPLQKFETIIDTILYNKNHDKLAVIFFTKNYPFKGDPAKRKLNYYDGSCYLAERKNAKLEFAWVGPYFSNFPDERDLSENIREYFFCESYRINKNGIVQYNQNDIRYWQSSIWTEYFPK